MAKKALSAPEIPLCINVLRLLRDCRKKNKTL